MIKVHFIATDSSAQTISAQPGQSLMQAATDANLPGIAADCGGTLTCATCHVLVAPEWAPRLPEPSADERAMLEFTAHASEAHSRLSCQIELTPTLDGLIVHLPASQH
jgi:2Fe-2S ferredoxin